MNETISMKKMKFTLKISFLFFLIVGGSAIWTQSLLYSQNNLMLNPHWESKKKDFILSNYLQVIHTRANIANYHFHGLNFLGYEHLISKLPFQLKELSLLFKIHSNSFLDIVFNDDGLVYSALRISKNPTFPSLFYMARANGKFIEHWPIKMNLSPKDTNKHLVVLKKSSSGLGITVSLDGQEILDLRKNFTKGHLGIRTGWEGAEVFNVMAQEEHGQRHDMNFDSLNDFLPFFIKNLIIFFTIILLSSLTIKFLTGVGYYQVAKKMSLFLLLIGAYWYIFDYCYYSKIPQIWDERQLTLRSNMNSILIFDPENFRHYFFTKWFDVISDKKIKAVDKGENPKQNLNLFAPIKCLSSNCINSFGREKMYKGDKKVIRILLTGGSFASYYGVPSIKDSFFYNLHIGISSHFTNKDIVIESLNISEGADFSDQLFNEQFEKIMLFQPDLIVMIDVIRKKTPAHLRMKLLSHFKEKGIKLIHFSKPDEMNVRMLLSRTEDMLGKFGPTWTNEKDEMVKGYTWSEFNLQKTLVTESQTNQGNYWWDDNHMTGHGQVVIASNLTKKIISLID